MGYYANSVEVDFSIPPESVEAALEAVNSSERLRPAWHPDTYNRLVEAVEDLTSFEECYMDDDGFNLGHHGDKYSSYTDALLEVLTPFAREGSYVRFNGESDELFGFQVYEGKLRSEFGVIEWRFCE